MNQGDWSENRPLYAHGSGADARKAQEAPARARYEQSYPGRSHRHTQASTPFPWSQLGLKDSIDMSHATSSIGGGESTHSYDSSRDLANYFREINGRKFSNQESTYMLPADETEFWRLDKQHAAFLVGLGDLYPCPDLVERVMAPREGKTIEMVDLGSGTGTWALSMARRFPHAQVLGIDLAPIPVYPDWLTPNIRFEIGDINLGLAHHAGRFDLVHMRCVGGGSNYAQAITVCAQLVRPGGLLLILDIDLQLCAEDKISAQKMVTPNQPEGSWLQRYFHEFRYAYAVNGRDIFEAEEVLDKGLWGHQLLEGCGAGSLFIPIGPWAEATNPEEAQRLVFGGILMRQNMRNVLHSIQTVMKRHGVPQDVLDQWVARCNAELDSLKIHNWIRLRMMWGQRNHVDAVNAGPATSDISANTTMQPNALDLSSSSWKPHEQVHIYQNAEESLQARKNRLDAIGELAEPLVLAAA